MSTHLHHHTETHFSSSHTVRDVVIGMSDGLTVPFALAAGLSGAIDHNHIIVTAGFAEIAAGAIAMGLGGYLAAKTEAAHFYSEHAREVQEVEEIPEVEAEECAEIFRSYGLAKTETDLIVNAIRRDKKRWVDFMMKFELGITAPDPKRAIQSAVTIAGSYILGGLIPLAPYVFIPETHRALLLSACLTLVALFIFGYVKGKFTTNKPLQSGWQTLLVGGMAASAAFFIAKLVGG